jgi:hypothetical protein
MKLQSTLAIAAFCAMMCCTTVEAQASGHVGTPLVQTSKSDVSMTVDAPSVDAVASSSTGDVASIVTPDVVSSSSSSSSSTGAHHSKKSKKHKRLSKMRDAINILSLDYAKHFNDPKPQQQQPAADSSQPKMQIYTPGIPVASVNPPASSLPPDTRKSGDVQVNVPNPAAINAAPAPGQESTADLVYNLTHLNQPGVTHS